jgi:hypothetical protein
MIAAPYCPQLFFILVHQSYLTMYSCLTFLYLHSTLPPLNRTGERLQYSKHRHARKHSSQYCQVLLPCPILPCYAASSCPGVVAKTLPSRSISASKVTRDHFLPFQSYHSNSPYFSFLHCFSFMDYSNATTTMAPSAVITSQRNSVQKGWERDREKERDTEEEALERDRAVLGSIHSCQSNIEGMDEDKEEEEEEGEMAAPTGTLSSALTPCHAMLFH